MSAVAGSLPSGIVTFVFSDVEGSTRLFHRIGDRFPPLLERHREILRDSWSAFGGAEVFLGAQQRSQNLELLVGQANNPHAVTSNVRGRGLPEEIRREDGRNR